PRGAGYPRRQRARQREHGGATRPMGNRGGAAGYVTRHWVCPPNRPGAGFNRLPGDPPGTIRGPANRFPPCAERLRPAAALAAHLCDVGAVNPAGDSAQTDGTATLELASRVHAEAMSRVDDDAQTLRDEGTAALLCDAPAVPLVAARRAGIPGFLLANFTWAD